MGYITKPDLESDDPAPPAFLTTMVPSALTVTIPVVEAPFVVRRGALTGIPGL